MQLLARIDACKRLRLVVHLSAHGQPILQEREEIPFESVLEEAVEEEACNTQLDYRRAACTISAIRQSRDCSEGEAGESEGGT